MYKMSSAVRSVSQVPANKLYINIADVRSTIYSAVTVDGATKAAWVNDEDVNTDLGAAGQAVFRDMGKTVYLPSLYAGSSLGTQSTILRKVQMVRPGDDGDNGTAQSSDSTYYTGYIALGGQSYGGGNGVATPVARLN
jgi:hypothetical protein